ncbi:Conjugative transfer protein TrbE [Acidithiobacillus caldus SM-1]|uniref:Conjugative transfer protein TrbE n=1 Tax=Acidithiobacillus caldus (strain SM-1) TaxID=990288 RepID=F9ZMR9_ACICS|nr:Hint domain-containing homing endonuclease [Acidithiobacillus caldus]AEK57829.1 Conjugative transfer protein TrbE [Acidithiobacillus caldus SM-1]
MLNIREFRSKEHALPDLLNPAILAGEITLMNVPCAVLLNKDGSFSAGIRFSGPDRESLSHAAIDRLPSIVNQSVSRLDAGWSVHWTAIRTPADDYVAEDRCHFPDPVSRLIDLERRMQFEQEGAHFLSTYYAVFTWQTPPESQVSAGQMFIETKKGFESDSFDVLLRKFEDTLQGAVGILRASFSIEPLDARGLLTHYHECLTGLSHPVNPPAVPAYLDVVLGHHDFIAGVEPSIDGEHIDVVTVTGFPDRTNPLLLEDLHNLPFPLRMTTRMVLLDPLESKKLITSYREKWASSKFTLRDYISAAMSQGQLRADRADPFKQAMEQETALADGDVSSGAVRLGFFTFTVVLRHRDPKVLEERMRVVQNLLNQLGFVAKRETVNAVEAFLGSLPGHTWENVRRPVLSTMNFADLSAKTAVWAGKADCPSALMKDGGKAAPCLLYGQTTGSTPFRLNLHVSDLGHSMILGPTGCHAKGHPILMADGTIRPVEEVRIGDRVMGPDGQPRTVLTLHRGLSDRYRIVPIKGEPFVVNGDHILSLKRGHDVPSRAGEICNISVRDYLRKSLTFRHYHKLYRCAVREFASTQDGESLPMRPYLLGVILGDGSCAWPSGVSVTNPDEEIAEALLQEAVGDGFGVTRRKPAGRGVPVFGITKGANAVLRDLGCLGKSAEFKSVPAMYKTGSWNTRLEILAGLLDTDGSLSHNGFDFISKSRQLAEDVVFIARSLGLAAYLSEAYKSCQSFAEPRQYWRVYISGNTDIIPTRVQRKQASERRQKKDVLVTGFHVEPAGYGAYYGFEIDGDHLYLDGHFLAHHNSGKSTILNLLAAQWLRYRNARVICFDKGRSMYALTEAVGGQHYDIGGEYSQLAFAPLERIDSPNERVFAEEWLESLAILQGVPMSAQERAVIHRAVEGLAQESGRSISDFVNLVQSIQIKQAIEVYTGTGKYGDILDARHDGLDMHANFVTFEMDSLPQGESAKGIVVPILLYIFHRIESMLDGRPTLIVLDEAWSLLDNPLFLNKIREWLKVLRKKNAAVVFATQSLADIVNNPLLPVLQESCPTKIFLPNVEAGSKNLMPMYESFGLVDRQIELLQMATPKREYYFSSPDGQRLVSFAFGPVALAFCAVSDPRDVKRVAELKAQYGDEWRRLWLAERLPATVRDSWVRAFTE